MLGIDDEDLAKGGNGFVEATLLLVDHARLEGQVAVLGVDAEPLLQ